MLDVRKANNKNTQFNIRWINEDKCGKIYSVQEMKIDGYKLRMEIHNFLIAKIDFSSKFSWKGSAEV